VQSGGGVVYTTCEHGAATAAVDNAHGGRAARAGGSWRGVSSLSAVLSGPPLARYFQS
jgi:hypothetical protein